ncbi:hypothetical protein BOSE62_71046 [Bosea sp. 62]|nr:hypothetical protein BOSE7B_60065 [Bosea sp. 7B]CAD5297155.1 hypothetical protein BOSE21B_90598 [Bosea sp. 21B]CAD5297451.1 hypothetical protein BOSE46_80680 [Bosea sp. 46]VVT61246.1 hypothetical protein BOS5A_230523 [Bosea sp. EC-HK365B]VXB21290.1 hypothetical protein BOSE125_130205 [Bosea sp. 125]VXB23090.1 hypothetical protein BOSE127_110065 [Bosea sp. 127]VXC80975.1 hypothetical protein BOSE29B_80565 [Bosea sp. 29B]VXC85682.1 hypothetical protein BOSE62_71046 [Bosea sp. 62]
MSRRGPHDWHGPIHNVSDQNMSCVQK